MEGRSVGGVGGGRRLHPVATGATVAVGLRGGRGAGSSDLGGTGRGRLGVGGAVSVGVADGRVVDGSMFRLGVPPENGVSSPPSFSFLYPPRGGGGIHRILTMCRRVYQVSFGQLMTRDAIS